MMHIHQKIKRKIDFIGSIFYIHCSYLSYQIQHFQTKIFSHSIFPFKKKNLLLLSTWQLMEILCIECLILSQKINFGTFDCLHERE